MFKTLIFVALAVSCVAAQGEDNAAPEPYAYAYQTENAAASEQRGPDGRVTGSYTIVDPADGRERRVEYFADASGFHAKVQTNELGTKSENPADVQVEASPASEAQLVSYRQQQVNYVQAPPTQQRVTYVQQQAAVPAVSTNSITTIKQQPQYVSANYRQAYAYQPGYTTGYTVVPNNYGYGYGYGNGNNLVYGTTGYNTGLSYNYHTPGQYYNNFQGYRYANQPTVVGVDNGQFGRYVATSGVRTVPAGQTVTYTTNSAPQVVATRTVSTASGARSADLGSGNVLVLQKKK